MGRAAKQPSAVPKDGVVKKKKKRSVCEHGKQKSQCRECKGVAICEHNRERRVCKDCGGSGICEHGRRRHDCKDCKGSSVCQHNRLRRRCKECGGASICEHNKQRRVCKDCGGSAICEHGRRRQQCKDCGGSQICEHGRQRSQCKDCGGVSMCEHGRRRRECKDCGGSSICEHGRRRQQCKECCWLVQPAIKGLSARAQDLESKGDWEGALGVWDLFMREAQKVVAKGQKQRRHCQEMQRQRQAADAARAGGEAKLPDVGTTLPVIKDQQNSLSEPGAVQGALAGEASAGANSATNLAGGTGDAQARATNNQTPASTGLGGQATNAPSAADHEYASGRGTASLDQARSLSVTQAPSLFAGDHRYASTPGSASFNPAPNLTAAQTTSLFATIAAQTRAPAPPPSAPPLAQAPSVPPTPSSPFFQVQTPSSPAMPSDLEAWAGGRHSGVWPR